MKSVLFSIFIVITVIAQDLPNPIITPGSFYNYITLTDICHDEYIKTFKGPNFNTKVLIFKRYGIDSIRWSNYVIDNLIPLELGGDNSIWNLWPQKIQGKWNYEKKDSLEHILRKLVCNGILSLKEAQKEIQTNWIDAYNKYISK